MGDKFFLALIEPMAQYGALGIIAIIFIRSMIKQSAQMLDMNKKIFEYFMKNNEDTNNSIKCSINSIVNIIAKNNDNINTTKHDILQELNRLNRDISNNLIDVRESVSDIKIEHSELDKSLLLERKINKYGNNTEDSKILNILKQEEDRTDK